MIAGISFKFIQRLSVSLIAIAAIVAFPVPNIAQVSEAERGIAIESNTGRDMKGHALVIGNSRYQYISPLTNPANDATDIASALKKLGFEVGATDFIIKPFSPNRLIERIQEILGCRK